MYFSSNLRILRKLSGLTQGELGQKIGKNGTNISNWEKGIAIPDIEIMTELSNMFGILIDLFLKVDFSMIDEADILKYVQDKNGNIGINKEDWLALISKGLDEKSHGIPYYKNLPASAGDLVTYFQVEKPTSYINLPEISDCNAVLPVYGNSMKGVVEPGDLIAIKEINTRTEFDSSMPHLVITNEYRMIKYLQVDDQDQAVIWAVSTNHPRIKLSADNILKVYAIKGIIRIF